MGRILAIDLGEKRVGLALSDLLKILASPFKTITYSSLKHLLTQIKEIIREFNVEKVVIGLPVREDGKEGSGCMLSRRFLDILQRDNIQAELWDERYSSKLAQRVLHEHGLKIKNNKEKIDKIAASYILDSYLRSISGKK